MPQRQSPAHQRGSAEQKTVQLPPARGVIRSVAGSIVMLRGRLRGHLFVQSADSGVLRDGMRRGFQVSPVERSLTAGDFEKRGVELHEGVFDRAILAVAGVAGGVGREHRPLAGLAEAEIGPFL